MKRNEVLSAIMQLIYQQGTWSLNKLSEELGMDKSTIKKVLNGENCNLKSYDKLMSLLLEYLDWEVEPSAIFDILENVFTDNLSLMLVAYDSNNHIMVQKRLLMKSLE